MWMGVNRAIVARRISPLGAGPNAIVRNSVSRPYAGSDRATGDHGEGHCQGKVVVERLYLGVPDDGC
jgi:hypothetical protein